jgi:Na+/H+-dicarboxylate symporter
MGEIEEVRENRRSRDDSTDSPSTGTTNIPAGPGVNLAQPEKKTFWQRVKEPGSVWQIIIAALLAIAIGLIVTTQVESVPPAAIAITAIPGTLWLRALRAVGMSEPSYHSAYNVLTYAVLPMIVTAMIMAIQRLRAMTAGGGKAGKLARWTIGYYIVTTIIAVAHSCLLVGLVWSKLMQPVSGDQLAVSQNDQETIDERKDIAIHEVIVDMFNSLVPQNIVDALATDSLLAVLVTAVVVGYVIKPGGALMRAVEEVEVMIMRIITILIYLAPIGVFHLIMPNLFRLNIAEIGLNLGVYLHSCNVDS